MEKPIDLNLFRRHKPTIDKLGAYATEYVVRPFVKPVKPPEILEGKLFRLYVVPRPNMNDEFDNEFTDG